MRDIGSEFEWLPLDDPSEGGGYPLSGVFTFSGRTAIRLVAEDVLAARRVRYAWLPSYCCDSMILPFADVGIPVRFYEVASCADGVMRAEVPACADDVVLTMSYFGFEDDTYLSWKKRCRETGAAIIEDQTHSLLSDEGTDAHYRVASLRKWFPIACGGLAEKTGGVLKSRLIPPDEAVISTRISAMQEKACYLSSGGADGSKESFLAKYRFVNEVYDTDYAERAGDDWSLSYLRGVDVQKIRRRRRENARLLLDALKDISFVSPMYRELGERDVPLFVPVLTPNHRELQKYLAGHGIYCPVHWPQPCDEAESDLYGQELSLICDQRYDRSDMNRMADVIRSFFA